MDVFLEKWTGRSRMVSVLQFFAIDSSVCVLNHCLNSKIKECLSQTLSLRGAVYFSNCIWDMVAQLFFPFFLFNSRFKSRLDILVPMSNDFSLINLLHLCAAKGFCHNSHIVNNNLLVCAVLCAARRWSRGCRKKNCLPCVSCQPSGSTCWNQTMPSTRPLSRSSYQMYYVQFLV